MDVFHKTIRGISGVREVKEFGEKMLEHIISLMRAEGGIILLFDEGRTRIISSKGVNESIFSSIEPPKVKSRVHRCLVEKGNMILPEELFDDFESLKKRYTPLAEMYFSALESSGDIIGFVGILKKKGNSSIKGINSRDIEVFCTLGAISGIALDNFLVYEKLRRRERIIDNLSRYFSPPVVESIMEKEGNGKLVGKSQATVLISDIEGFSSMAELLPSDVFVEMMNEFLSTSIRVVFKRKGTVDKFTGDGVLAVFGIPVKDENHAKSALLSARDMFREIGKLNEKWRSKALPPLKIRIGIATGEVIYGDIGSEERMEFTTMGSTVNLASRLEQLNKKFKSRLLISQETYRRVKNMVLVTEHTTKIRGFSGVQKVYEVLTFLEKRK